MVGGERKKEEVKVRERARVIQGGGQRRMMKVLELKVEEKAGL